MILARHGGDSLTIDMVDKTLQEMEAMGSCFTNLEKSVNGGITMVLGNEIAKTQ